MQISAKVLGADSCASSPVIFCEKSRLNSGDRKQKPKSMGTGEGQACLCVAFFLAESGHT